MVNMMHQISKFESEKPVYLMKHLFYNLTFLFSLWFCFIYSPAAVNAQGQVIRGKVVDKQTQMALPGASVVLQNSEPLLATSTGSNGAFRISNVPLGRQAVLVTYVGYHPVRV